MPATPTALERQAAMTAQLDDFFGGSVSRPAPAVTHTSSRNSRELTKSKGSIESDETAAPPAYGTPDHPAPSYDTIEEPRTLAMFLFKYGFLFPPFWLIGTLILFMELKDDDSVDCESGKTKQQKADEITLLRRTELRWAKRCAMAFVGLLVAIALIIFGLYMAHVGVFKKHS